MLIIEIQVKEVAEYLTSQKCNVGLKLYEKTDCE